MKHYLSIVIVLIVILGSQCIEERVDPVIEQTSFSCDDKPVVCNLTANNGNFAIDIFKNINANEDTGENIFISPFSISTALSMTANGAAGETLSEMLATLKTGELSLDEVNDAYKVLLETLPYLDPATTVKIANSIWPQVNYPVLPGFLTLNEDKYLSEVIPVDFSDAAVLDQVNNWIKENTDGLIPQALDELPGSLVMLLINAIYFKGDWQTEFDIADTQEAPFYTLDGSTQVDMMHIPEGAFPYFQNELFQAVDLAYGDSIYSMSVFLPKPGYNVEDVIGALNPESWNEWTTSFFSENLNLFMPKFDFEYDIKLKPTLSSMGMGIAFSDRADFSKMIDGSSVKIDEVIHKAVIEVNEQGSEAAAVTIVEIIETSAGLAQEVNMNRPFFFVIRDNATNTILFMGKVMQP